MANNNTELKGWAKYCKEQNIEFSTKRIFIDGLGGRSFGDGVFRVFERSDLEGWHRVVSGCFTKLRSEFNLIG